MTGLELFALGLSCTNAENVRRGMALKRRLGHETVTEIRNSTTTVRALAAKHGVVPSVISAIRRGEIYREQAA